MPIARETQRRASWIGLEFSQITIIRWFPNAELFILIARKSKFVPDNINSHA